MTTPEAPASSDEARLDERAADLAKPTRPDEHRRLDELAADWARIRQRNEGSSAPYVTKASPSPSGTAITPDSGGVIIAPVPKRKKDGSKDAPLVLFAWTFGERANDGSALILLDGTPLENVPACRATQLLWNGAELFAKAIDGGWRRYNDGRVPDVASAHSAARWHPVQDAPVAATCVACGAPAVTVEDGRDVCQQHAGGAWAGGGARSPGRSRW
jgi:hypothetical protein